jgi:hypothetical protein
MNDPGDDDIRRGTSPHIPIAERRIGLPRSKTPELAGIK